jgi:hypothetical protein
MGILSLRTQEACDSLTKGNARYNAFRKFNPDMKAFHDEEYIGILRQRFACPKQ